MNLQSNHIRALLRNTASARSTSCATTDAYDDDDDSAALDASLNLPLQYNNNGGQRCDIGYVLFLEDVDEPPSSWNMTEWLADVMIRTFAPTPSNIVHCELVVPPVPDSSEGRVHFATYLGSDGANWQSRGALRASGVNWYLVENGARWRALPVFGTDCANAMREAAEANVDAPYSLKMYATSAKPLRSLSFLWSDYAKHQGHCATLTTRVLKAANVDAAFSHGSPWYAPSSLFSTLSESLSRRQAADPETMESLRTTDPTSCVHTIASLLHAPLSYENIRELGDSRCIDAVRELTGRVLQATGDGADGGDGGRKAQNDLAKALLRWVLLRRDACCPD